MPVSVTFRVEMRIKVDAVSENKNVNSICYRLLLESKIDTNELIKRQKNTLRHRIKLMANKGGR